ncbi:hypothetical protein J2S30_004170 [Herbaspirillum rubrisubalbicans]|jgi:hypothetical protein|uniref:hypothetical protein n=1 Tax=Herbaspirillum rubrisubalbicans TaxID=80842 RepID=UPI00209C803B|nr:hypothetical protein [Herbaspirillum rubrisubalbicans]MCP1575791.1 hypothetical protein [Herbaspirillum rubrisubalbicans]
MYKFDTDEILGDGRAVYKIIRWRLLNNFYVYSQDSIGSGNIFQTISDFHRGRIEFAYQRCTSIYRRPIERLMLEILTLVLDARRSSDDFQREHQEKILQILAENSLSGLLSNLPEEERKSFEFDLKLLKIS